MDSCKLIDYENYIVLQNKVKYLLKTSSKLSTGTTNLNAILGSKNSVLNKDDIRYQCGFQRK